MDKQKQGEMQNISDQIMKLMTDNGLEFSVNQSFNIQVVPKKIITGEQSAPKEKARVIDVSDLK